jgi:hypothetical protein
MTVSDKLVRLPTEEVVAYSKALLDIKYTQKFLNQIIL